eukprot:4443584-Prymnesium_polylepis.2
MSVSSEREVVPPAGYVGRCLATVRGDPHGSARLTVSVVACSQVDPLALSHLYFVIRDATPPTPKPSVAALTLSYDGDGDSEITVETEELDDAPAWATGTMSAEFAADWGARGTLGAAHTISLSTGGSLTVEIAPAKPPTPPKTPDPPSPPPPWPPIVQAVNIMSMQHDND